MGRLQANLNYAGIEEVMEQGLHHYLDWLQRSLNDVGDAIQTGFFGYAPAPPSATTSATSQHQSS